MPRPHEWIERELFRAAIIFPACQFELFVASTAQPNGSSRPFFVMAVDVRNPPGVQFALG